MLTPTAMSESSESELHSVRFVHSVSGRLLPSASRWNSIELDFGLLPARSSSDGFDSLPSRFSKSVDFNLFVSDKKHFKRCAYVSIFVLVLVPLLVLLLHVLPHKKEKDVAHKDLTLALKQALLFFDAQKSGYLPENYPVDFRANSGLNDGKDIDADLVGGFYDSGNNIKSSFSTAYIVTLLSWTVVEYQQKYSDIGELEHIKDIIKWGSDYLLKLFVPPNSTSDSAILYSQVGGNNENQENDVKCWQRPEDMDYPRPVSVCDETCGDLAGEIVAGLSAASLVLSEEKDYSKKLIESAENLFGLATAGEKYNSSSYIGELVWGGTWLFFATGNTSYLQYATDNFGPAEMEELPSFYWKKKLTANAILMTRIRYFMDLGYPYEEALSTNRTDLLMCSYVSDKHKLSVTNGGLILIKPDDSAPLQYAATASFLSKLYSDYLQLLQTTVRSCGDDFFSVEVLQNFSISQVNYILGDNPMKMSYMVGYSDHYPTHVHHRAASIPWDGKQHSCSEGNAYLISNDKNPNNLLGAMVGGPDKNDNFLDDREKPWFTEPSISSNAGLVAALIAVHDPPIKSVGSRLGIDKIGIFRNVKSIYATP